MSGHGDFVLTLVAGIAMLAGGGWMLCVTIPRDSRRRRRMLPATGTIQDGLDASNPFKALSDVAQGAGTAAVPMVRFTTRDGIDIVTNVGVLRDGNGANRTTFAIGQQVSLAYDPEHPKIVAIDGQPSRMRFHGMICAILLISGIGLLYGLRNA